MKTTFRLEGMTCESCEWKVQYLLGEMAGVTTVSASKDKNEVEINWDKTHTIPEMQEVLGGKQSKYTISEIKNTMAVETTKSWWQTYKPILVVFGYISTITLVIQTQNAGFDLMQWMRHFMAAFFLVFSFFKMLNLRAFAQSYAMYDVVAKQFSVWGYIYAFVEFLLGIAYLINFNPFFTNLATLIVMTVSIVGVLQSVLNKKQIQCACLGTVFNLPMSSITIIEDGLMIAMSAAMLVLV
ncbi:MAG: cation transporter [Flavobacteriales bacterium]|nr:cation transporter [Flavobacteriales bacterium]